MGSMAVLAVILLLLAASVPAIFAVTYQVGDASGWNSGVDYTVWVTGKTFRVGDTLEFQYGPSHSVSVVDKAGFDSCDGSGATQMFSDGDTKINLTKVGTMHFLCPTPGHCQGGMKLSVPVLAAPSTPATPPPQSSPKSPPPSSKSPPLSPRSPRKPKTHPPSASPPAKSESLTPSQSPSTLSPSPSPSPLPPNAASKGVMSYGMMVFTVVLMVGIMN